LAGEDRSNVNLAHVNHKLARTGCFAIALIAGYASPALADGRVSVYGGAQFVDNGASDTVGLVQPDVAIGYDLGPRTNVPVHILLDADYAFGTGEFSDYSVLSLGASVRLTTPTYFGVGASYDFVNVQPQFYVYPGVVTVPQPTGFGSSFTPPPTSASAPGVDFFAGQKLVSTRRYGLAIEASYRFIPNVGNTNPSGFSIGLRGSFL
jgi:hypothetical protein